MKILQLVQCPQRRGAEIFAYTLSSYLASQNHTVRTAYLYPGDERCPLPLKEGDVVVGSSERSFSENVMGFDPKILKELIRISSEFEPDIIQVNGGRTIKYGALLRTMQKNKKWVLVYRNIGDPVQWVRGWQRKLIYRKVLSPKISGIVAVSAATLQSVKTVYDFRGPMTVIPRGVDPIQVVPKSSGPEVRSMLNTPHDSPVLVYVGSITQEKRLDRLLAITKRILHHIPQTYLWIVGDGPLRPEIEALSKTQGISQQIRFTGTQEDVASFISAANLLVLTSDTEGIPGVVLEAALLEIPAVASQVGGVPECILHDQTGMIVAPSDEAGFEAAILKLLMDKKCSSEYGKKAKEWILSRFTMDRVAGKYLEFYRGLMKNGNREESSYV